MKVDRIECYKDGILVSEKEDKDLVKVIYEDESVKEFVPKPMTGKYPTIMFTIPYGADDKFIDVKELDRYGVLTIYQDGTFNYNDYKARYNYPDGSYKYMTIKQHDKENDKGIRESKEEKFTRLYGIAYDDNLTYSQNVFKAKGL